MGKVTMMLIITLYGKGTRLSMNLTIFGETKTANSNVRKQDITKVAMPTGLTMASLKIMPASLNPLPIL